MQLGAVFPQTEIQSDAIVIRDFAQAVEALGFHHLLAYDHVVGKNTSNIPDWNMPYNHESPFQEPLVLFSYLSGVTQKLAFMSAVLILSQRQTVLVAKQAACVDVYCQGRLRLGMGVGWNEVEYAAMNENFSKRGKRIEDQFSYLRRCWTEETFIYKSEFHNMDDGGIKPLPIQRPIPLWVGGISTLAMKRAARIGDGWIPFALPGSSAVQTMDRFRGMVEAAGRDPASVPMEMILFMGRNVGTPVRPVSAVIEEACQWRDAGVSAVSLDTMGANLKNLDAHLEAMKTFSEELGA